jgi:hypothetical protein
MPAYAPGVVQAALLDLVAGRYSSPASPSILCTNLVGSDTESSMGLAGCQAQL